MQIFGSSNRDSSLPRPNTLRARTNQFILGALTQLGTRRRCVFTNRVNRQLASHTRRPPRTGVRCEAVWTSETLERELERKGQIAVAGIAVISHSDYGHTWRQAQAVYAGAQAAGAIVDLVGINQDGEVADAGWDALTGADGIVFGCPTHMGGPSWQFKRFADATNHRTWVPTLWRDKFSGGFTNSAAMSGDKFSTLTYFWTLAMQHGMVWIGSGMKPAIGFDKNAPRESLNFIGAYTGVMASSPLNDPADM